MKKPSEGSSEHSTLWQAMCVLQKKSIDGCIQGSRAGRPIAAVGIHMCVFLNTHMSGREQTN